MYNDIQANEQIIDFETPLYKKTNIRTLAHVVKSSKNYTNKEIKELINDLKYQLPF